MDHYPKIGLRGIHEIAKRISHEQLSYSDALKLIRDVLMNHDLYWKDSKKYSEPEKGKFVRDAWGTKLGLLLYLINTKILKPHDHLLPAFIYGGISDQNHLKAAKALLGSKRNRRLLSLDIKSFFENVTQSRVFYFFYNKARCKKEAAEILALICCVPEGKKGSGSSKRIIGRGFATSPRLAIWTNLDVFQKIYWKAKRMLKKHDPRLAIYVDDIGVTASNIDEDRMKIVCETISKTLSSDKNQPLPINPKKTKNISFREGAEHLGTKLGRNKLSVGSKSKSKLDKLIKKLGGTKSKKEKKILINKKRAYHRYKQQIAKTNQPSKE